MNEMQKENLAIAIVAGIITFAVTYATAQYINPGLQKMIK